MSVETAASSTPSLSSGSGASNSSSSATSSTNSNVYTGGSSRGMPGGAASSSSASAGTGAQPAQSSGNDTQAGQAQSQTQPQQPQYYELQVNGRPVKMTLDEVLAHARMSHAADAKFQEAARQRKEAQALMEKFKKSPIEALMDPALGLTEEQIRTEMEKFYTQRYIEPETLSPQERRARELERELQSYKQREREMQEQEYRTRETQAIEHEKQYLSQQIIEGLEKSGLPKKNAYLMSRMAFYMKQAIDNGWDAPMEVIISKVKNEERSRLGALTQDSSAEQLIELLGEGVIQKIREHDLKQLRAARQFPSAQPQASYGGSSSNNEDKIGYDEVERRLRAIRMGKM